MWLVHISAAVELILNQSSARHINAILSKANVVMAPDLYIAEVTNVFWKYNQYEELPEDICEQSIEKALELIDEFVESRTLYKEAFSLSCMAKHPVYDMLYLVLTRRTSGIFLTADKNLGKLASKYSIKLK